jgi:hypothetical protein
VFFDNSSFVGSLLIKFNNIANIEMVRDEHLICVDVLDDAMTRRVDDLRPLHDYISVANALIITKTNINPIVEVVWDLFCVQLVLNQKFCQTFKASCLSLGLFLANDNIMPLIFLKLL